MAPTAVVDLTVNPEYSGNSITALLPETGLDSM
jgi:hypothetical protein